MSRHSRPHSSEEGLSVLGWRDTPVFGDAIGRVAAHLNRYIEQIFVRSRPEMTRNELERKLYLIRKGLKRNRRFGYQDKGFFSVPRCPLDNRLQRIAASPQ